VLFLKSFFLKVGNPVSSGGKKGFFLQLLTTFTEDGASDIPVVSLTSRRLSATLSSGFQPGPHGNTFGMAAFFCCALFLRAASFSNVGMFPWQ
jgi:hypothetical protein